MATFSLIDSKSISSTATEIEFANISSAYTDLCIFLSARGSSSGNEGSITIRFNSDTASNYEYRYWYSFSNTIYQGTDSGATSGITHYSVTGNGQGSNWFGNAKLYIPNYTVTSNKKQILIESVTSNTAAADGQLSSQTYGLWNNTTNAISNIKLISGSQSFSANTTAYLYGITTSGATGASTSTT
jgi:hypothetical protein